jgi:hypothetical protein
VSNVRTGLVIICLVALAGGAKILRHHAHRPHWLPHWLHARNAHRAVPPLAAGEPGWTIEVGTPGTAVFRYRNVEVGTFRYVYWGKGWTWGDPQVNSVPGGADAHGDAFSVEVPSLRTKILGSVRTSDRALTFAFTVATTEPQGDARGGLEFAWNTDSPVLAGQAPDVSLRGEDGFDVALSSAPGPSVRFEPPMRSVHFEGGNEEQIRCYFDDGHISPSTRRWTMTISLPPGGTVRRSVAQRYGRDDASGWTPDTVVWDKWPIDVSFLNDGDRPAGAHGRVRARGDRLVFEDGTVARFWGTNVAAYALFRGDKDVIANQAKRIAALGYNLVRIHHHDSDWVSPNVFADGETTQKLNEAALDAIDWWVKCLRDQGVYVWLDLKVGRRFRAGDAVDGFAELAKGDPTGRGFDYVDPRLGALEDTFVRQYLARPNRYTGRSYLEDPAVFAVLVRNEDDLTTHFANSMLPNKGNPVHGRMLRAAVEKPAASLGVSIDDAMRTWEPGPSKMVLADIEARVFQHDRSLLRDVGFGGLFAGTSYWGGESLFSVASLAASDVVDVHSYGDEESLSTNPRYQANFIPWIGAAQLVGKPLTISEWNAPYPTRDRFTTPLYVAAIGDLQGWDAPMVFTYSQHAVEAPVRADTWSTAPDPAMTALMPAAALMFRQQHVKQARQTFCLHPTRDAFYGTDINPATSLAVRTIIEQSRLVVALPDIPQVTWDDGASRPGEGDVVVTDPSRDFLPPGATKVRSDTGELERDWEAGVETIDTPMSQAAMGWIGGRKIALRDVALRIDTPKAAVALTSLDGRPIASSAKVLLTLVAQVATGAGNALPFRAQPVSGSIVWRSSQRPRVMRPLLPTGGPGDAPLAGRLDPAGQVFELPRGFVTHWWLLEPTAVARPRGATPKH